MRCLDADDLQVVIRLPHQLHEVRSSRGSCGAGQQDPRIGCRMVQERPELRDGLLQLMAGNERNGAFILGQTTGDRG